MSEVRLPAPVTTNLVDVRKFLDDDDSIAPGGIAFDLVCNVMWYACPCGCGIYGCLPIGNGFKPDRDTVGRDTWKWDGNREAPTLSPSVHHIGHWHGWLKNGVWVQA